MQYNMRKHVIHVGGIAFFYMNADAMVFQRSKDQLRMLGLYHDNGKFSNRIVPVTIQQ